MTLATFTPPVAPFTGSKSKPEIKLKKAEFGDGYTQITRDGINHIRQVYSLSWDKLTRANAESIVAFFEQQGGDTPFYFQMSPTSPLLKWTCEEWEMEFLSAGLGGVTATFRQSFYLAS